MGNILKKKKKLADVTVDPPEEEKKNPKTQKFSLQIFRKGEWPLLKAFCQKHGIRQAHLIVVFQTYLSHDEVYVRKFRVRLTDPKLKFAPFSTLMQELADIFFPSIYLKEFPRLEDVDSNEDVTFTRFIIMSYIFGAQAIPDLFYDFLSILRKNLKIHTTALVAVYSFQQICNLVIEDLKNCGTVKYLKKAIASLDTNKDFKISTILLIGIKYPLLFYSLVRFRKYFQRYVFGDRFWSDRKHMKLKSVEFHIHPEFHLWFENETVARKYTARFFLMDVLYENRIFDLNTIFYETILDNISRDEMLTLIDLVGYKFARRLTLEGEITFDRFDPVFIGMFSTKIVSSAAGNHEEKEQLNEMDSDGDIGSNWDSRPTSPSKSINEGRLENRNGSAAEESETKKNETENSLSQPRLQLIDPKSLEEPKVDGIPPAIVEPSTSPLKTIQKQLSSLMLPASPARIQVSSSDPQTPQQLKAGEQNIIENSPKSRSPMVQLFSKQLSTFRTETPQEGKRKDRTEVSTPLTQLQKQMSTFIFGVEEPETKAEDLDDEDENESDSMESYEEDDEQNLEKIDYLTEEDKVTIIHDNEFQKDFVYDVHTGRARWVRTARTSGGRLLKKFV